MQTMLPKLFKRCFYTLEQYCKIVFYVFFKIKQFSKILKNCLNLFLHAKTIFQNIVKLIKTIVEKTISKNKGLGQTVVQPKSGFGAFGGVKHGRAEPAF